ncbi:NAD(P)-binding protein [Periconia macrospinosa]|uniref:NAD(P)-binding protein n=1 Tax=Periconia macrospinosa TaxID=97972 RepID=A0A2V1DXU6_9PLEO|nr:NAD(P)-binding protein [Periconia macrospinosa]
MSEVSSQKLICVVGATGNQGGSVARRFHEAGYRVRGLSRNPSSPAAQKLVAEGIEVVAADLDDVATLVPVFQGANAIFSVTQYWEPFMRPDCRQKAKEQGITCRKFAYDVEYQHGKNITDAAATTVESLDANGFLVSTLSHAGKCSKGAYTDLYHFDSKADIYPAYVEEKYPDLAAKMSCIHTGYFFTSFNILPNSYFGKLPDGSIQMAFTTAPDRLLPHFDPVGDTGNFTYAVSQLPPGKAYMAAGTFCSWTSWINTWSAITGAPVSYKQITQEEMIDMTDDKDLGLEVALMYSYANDPGYDGGMDLLTADDIRKLGVECPMTTWEEWAKKYDWSAILAT